VPGALLDLTGALLDFTKEIFTNIKKVSGALLDLYIAYKN